MRVLLVGAGAGDHAAAARRHARGVELVPTTEVVEMHDPPASVRTKKDSSIVVAAELVRDGKADAMVSAGQHRRGHGRRAAAHGSHQRASPGPAIAVPSRCPGDGRRSWSTVARPSTARPSGSASSRSWAASTRGSAWGSTSPASACSRTARRPARATTCARPCTRCSSRCPGFIGNVEGRDFMHDTVDVIVTDGFTGNVALKTVEGAIRGTAKLVFDTLDVHARAAGGGRGVMPALLDGGASSSTPTTSEVVHAPRRRRRLRDLARLVERAGDEATRCAGRVECVEARRRRADEGGGGRCRLRPTWSAARSVPTTCSG